MSERVRKCVDAPISARSFYAEEENARPHGKNRAIRTYSTMMKLRLVLLFGLIGLLTAVGLYFGIRTRFPQPYRKEIERTGLDPLLVYSVIKAESGFDEKAVSRAGAVGLMQLRPATAKFICERENRLFEEERLTEAEYNLFLGCKYLEYLMGRFPVIETALAAYNAGEGTVSDWLTDRTCSEDGMTLHRIPYAETRAYVKKIGKFRKIYEFYY